jgi:DNA-binding transcriptional MerR regulator
MADPIRKSEHAFRTIGELAGELGVPQHILRYWETRFPQLRPLQRAGNRRYYRPEDMALARRIHRLLNEDGYTIRGVQQLLARNDRVPGEDDAAAIAPPAAAPAAAPAVAASSNEAAVVPLEELRALRHTLASALQETAH